MACGSKRADCVEVDSKGPSLVDTPQGLVSCAIWDKPTVEASDGVAGDNAIHGEDACG